MRLRGSSGLFLLAIIAAVTPPNGPAIAAETLAAPESVDPFEYLARQVRLELFQWENVDGYAIASFVINNAGDQDITSSSLECKFFEPSLGNLASLDTVHGHTPIQAHQTQQFSAINLGFVGALTEQLDCELDDLVLGPPKAKAE